MVVLNEPLSGGKKSLGPHSRRGHTTGLIKVRYGENQIAIFNSRCQRKMLIECMKERCIDLEATADSLDLITWRGDLQNLSQNTHVYANDFLKERETYVLLRVVYDKTQPNPQYSSLLENLDKLNPELASTLNDLSKPQHSREIRAKWASLGRKGAEASTASHTSHTSNSKGLNTILESSSRRGGSRFVELIATAVKNKDLLDNSDEEPIEEERSSRKGSGRKSSASSTSSQRKT